MYIFFVINVFISYYYIDDEEIASTSCFCWSAEIDFQHLARPRNVSVDLKYDVLVHVCVEYTRLCLEK